MICHREIIFRLREPPNKLKIYFSYFTLKCLSKVISLYFANHSTRRLHYDKSKLELKFFLLYIILKNNNFFFCYFFFTFSYFPEILMILPKIGYHLLEKFFYMIHLTLHFTGHNFCIYLSVLYRTMTKHFRNRF